ncbi:hypothetical protein SAMN05421819_3946 [Bryocella elongata]|uniref:Uncharacterized protein n=1 Tax=Bryocella elongata TaxID=863522 RepID=A0A1H6BQZ9_9BACT|nr:hypothetical protein [Bryocella elongata]SEG63113.1 hypothetical protein SAMN05421819_3946 [Bryocella elongata]
MNDGPRTPDNSFMNGARSSVVNRTHRVIREQALVMQAQRRRQRSLWVPIGLCSTLLISICYAVWFLMDSNDITPTGVPDASDQMFLITIWSLPITVALLLMVWFRLGRTRHADNFEAR